MEHGQMNKSHFKTVAALARVRTIIEKIRVLANAATSTSITSGMMAALAFLCAATAFGAEQPDRPNILWISLEDITPMMGCYGDSYARTPVFDQLSAEGIRYTKAHSIAPVCSVSRSSIITGMYPSSLGTHHHRSNVGKPPAFVEMLPNLMREAGYYTSNNSKKDYNMGGVRWHESSGKAHWRNRLDPSTSSKKGSVPPIYIYHLMAMGSTLHIALVNWGVHHQSVNSWD